MFTRSQRINRNRGFVLIVLAPVHKHLTLAQFLLHIGNHQISMLVFQQPGEGVGKGFGVFITGGTVERNVDLQSLGAGRLGKTLQPEVFEDFPQPHANLGTLHDIGGWSGIEIKNHHGGAFDLLCQRKRRMQFDGGQIRHPHHGREIVGQNVVHIAVVAFTPDGSGLHPIRAVLGGVLFKEELAVHAIGIAFQRQRASCKMGDEDGRDAGVVVNHLSLGKSGRGIQDLIQIRQLQLPALNFNHRFVAHIASSGFMYLARARQME